MLGLVDSIDRKDCYPYVDIITGSNKIIDAAQPISFFVVVVVFFQDFMALYLTYITE